jgi:aminoglycoside phosphotransferase (APT) family kinase protein
MSETTDEGAEDAAKQAIAQVVGAATFALEPKAGGLTNLVFEAETPRGLIIVRLSTDANKKELFERERRAMARASETGIPTPAVYGIGTVDKWTYMVAQRLSGEPALHHPRRFDILQELGRMAARMHTIRTEGYGPAFVWKDETPPSDTSWSEWLLGHLQAEARLLSLARREMISARQLSVFTDTLRSIEIWSDPPVLNHGDLRLKNVIADRDGAILGIIDWECCVSSIGPHWDLSLALHDLSIDAKEVFLAGYGLAEPSIRVAAPVWRLLNVLNYAPHVEALIERGDTLALDRLRTRLSGALELYCVG